MVNCSAYMCGSSTCRKDQGITFHRFPKEPKLQQLWIDQLKLKDFQPNASKVLCSKHFESHLIDNSGFRTILRTNAVPTIFLQLPKYLQAATLQPKRESDYQVSDSSEFHSEDEIKKEPLAGPSRLPEQPDEIALFAKSVEDKLRKLNEDNRVIAKHQINDILMRLEMEQASSIEVKVESDDEDVLD